MSGVELKAPPLVGWMSSVVESATLTPRLVPALTVKTLVPVLGLMAEEFDMLYILYITVSASVNVATVIMGNIYNNDFLILLVLVCMSFIGSLPLLLILLGGGTISRHTRNGTTSGTN